MAGQLPLHDNALAPELPDDSRSAITLLPDLAYQRHVIVNVAYIGLPYVPGAALKPEWVLVDAGVKGSAGSILKGAAELFGPEARPRAIVLTHAHFDHVGALEELAARWDVPIYAHPRERPFLAGERAYPPPDPGVGGGLMARMAGLFPRDPIDVRPWLRTLPPDGSVPHLPAWRWVHTPGHSPGHVAFWREADRTLIVGDAFITTRQESLWAVLTQRAEMHGPPQYFTSDWVEAEASVRRLAELAPELVLTGHGRPMRGSLMRERLYELARDFKHVAVPSDGTYVGRQIEV